MERSTRQGTAIRAAIEREGRPLSPQEVLEAARGEVPSLGIATVYRNLKDLLESGEIGLVALPGESPRYESRQAAGHHHHHFRCDRCGRVFDVQGCGGLSGIAVPPGFAVQRHEITLYGVCAECRAGQAADADEAAPSADAGCGHGHRH
jgi:Fur family ferric uptake transcriptional regulator